MTKRADQFRQDNFPAHFTALVQQAFAKASHHPTDQIFAPCDFWLFPKLKSHLKERRFVNATLTQYTSSVNGVSLPTG
jgi:hypothetical protein